MTETLHVQTAHRFDCRFGPGLYRITFHGPTTPAVRYCQTQREVEQAVRLLNGIARDLRVERDGHCLDGPYGGDAHTPDVVDGEAWLAMPREDGMRELGITNEADYARAYAAIEAAVVRRNNREAQGGVHASIVVKKRGARVVDAE
jgi:hypothetical protein